MRGTVRAGGRGDGARWHRAAADSGAREEAGESGCRSGCRRGDVCHRQHCGRDPGNPPAAGQQKTKARRRSLNSPGRLRRLKTREEGKKRRLAGLWCR